MANSLGEEKQKFLFIVFTLLFPTNSNTPALGEKKSKGMKKMGGKAARHKSVGISLA